MRARVETIGLALRPGAMLGLVVTVIVGMVGLVQLDQRLMLIGLIAGPLIVILNVVVSGVTTWHEKNTRLEATYLDAEDMIRLRHLQSARRSRQP